VNASALWTALLVVGVLIEIVGRIRPGNVSNLSRAASMAAARIPGRLMLIAFWLFVGFHLFARYTVPHH
jgi:hypothetical protein